MEPDDARAPGEVALLQFEDHERVGRRVEGGEIHLPRRGDVGVLFGAAASTRRSHLLMP